MRNLGILTAAAALVAMMGFGGTAKAEIDLSFDPGQLVGYWHFDTNAGNTNALDGSVNTNDGTLTGDATRDVGALPPVPNNTNSLSLGTTTRGSMQTAGGSGAINLTGDYTVAAWFKTSTTSTTMDIVSVHNAAGTKHGLLAEVRSDGKLPCSGETTRREQRQATL